MVLESTEVLVYSVVLLVPQRGSAPRNHISGFENSQIAITPQNLEFEKTTSKTVASSVLFWSPPSVCCIFNQTYSVWPMRNSRQEKLYSLDLVCVLCCRFALVCVGSEASSRKLLDLLSKRELHGQNPIVTPCNKQSLSQFELQSRKSESHSPSAVSHSVTCSSNSQNRLALEHHGNACIKIFLWWLQLYCGTDDWSLYSSWCSCHLTIYI